MDTTHHNTGKHRPTRSEKATARSRLRWLAVATMVFITMLTESAQADQWSLLVNGKAIHLDHPAGTDYNEKNWGAGIQYDFDMTASKWIPFISASGFLDSNNNPSYYAGGGTMRRFAFGAQKDSLHLDAGIVAFFMIRQGYMNGSPFPGVLPVLSFGTDRLALNMTYIPKVEPKMVPLLFFQLKIGLF
jgi:hypothetical protein